MLSQVPLTSTRTGVRRWVENCKRTSLPAKMRVAPPRCAASFTELIHFVQGPVTLFEVQYWRQSTSYPPPTVTSYRYALEPSTSLIPLSSEVAVPSMGGRMQCALRLDVAKAAVVYRSSVSTSNPIERKIFLFIGLPPQSYGEWHNKAKS